MPAVTPSRKPRPKVAAAGLAGAIVTAVTGTLVWAGAPEPPALLVAAYTTVIGFVVAYFTRED